MKFKVMSYNIHKGFDNFNFNFVLHELKEAIQSVQADIVLLQEVVGLNTKHEKSIDDWPKQSQFEFLADQIWSHYSYGKNAVWDEQHHGNAILSKWPILNFENINISNNKYEKRGLLHCQIMNPKNESLPIHIFNVHLDLLHVGRKKQLAKIIDRAKKFVPEAHPFILGGDFNDWNQKLSPDIYEFLGASEGFKLSQGAYSKSFPSFLPTLSLDRIYFKHLRVSSSYRPSQKPWSELSDHLPIIVEFEL